MPSARVGGFRSLQHWDPDPVKVCRGEMNLQVPKIFEGAVAVRYWADKGLWRDDGSEIMGATAITFSFIDGPLKVPRCRKTINKNIPTSAALVGDSSNMT